MRRLAPVWPLPVLALFGTLAASGLARPPQETSNTPSPANTADPCVPPPGVPTVKAVTVQDPKSKENPTEFALGKTILVSLCPHNVQALRTAEKPNNKLGLYLNQQFMKGLDPGSDPGDPDTLRFSLGITPENRYAWSQLFNRKISGLGGDVPVTVGLADASMVAASDKSLQLEFLPDWKAKVMLAVSLLVAGLTLLLGIKSPMLRDSGDPGTDWRRRTYSLGRFQMAVWFVTIVFAFLFIFAVTGDAAPITKGALILMGLATGTALGSATIDSNKRAASESDRLSLTAEKASIPQAIQDIDRLVSGLQPGDPNLPVLQQQRLGAQQRLLVLTDQLAKLPGAVPDASQGFILDVLSDDTGVSFHRLQMLGWTLVFWVLFMSSLFAKLTMMDFDTTQLALMGISSSTYLGFKLQE
ncbi:MAG TPA: hypothetical protein VIX19_03330 [Terriglobales bacterium]